MHTTARALLVIASALLVVACGGGGDDGSSSKQERSAGATARDGYFAEAQSDLLNPLLADYDAATKSYYEQAKPCERQAARLFKAGRTPRQSVQCHLTRTKEYRDAVVALREGLDGIDGDYREACESQVESFLAFLAEFDAAIEAEHADWEAYASNRPTPQIQAHATAVDEHAARFTKDEIPAMSKACYTKQDREAAGKA